MAAADDSSLAFKLVAEPLGRTQLFEGVSREALDAIAARAVRLLFRKGDVIVHQGEPGDRMFVVVEGAAQVYVTSPGAEGEEVVLAALGPSETFGELTLLDGEPRSASVRATAPTVVFAIGRTDLRTVMGTNPPLVDAMLLSLARTVRRLTDHTADAVFFAVHQRVASLILDLAREKVGGKHSALQLDLRRTETELADILGRSRQSVAQVLASFEAMGCLEVRGHIIHVSNPDALRRQMSSEMTWAELADKALHDPLTRLANRRLFTERVQSGLARSRRQHGQVSVLFIDLDDFKLVNDRHSHAAGDRLLCAVADRLRGCLRINDTAARFGGDEFGVLLDDIAGAPAAEATTQRILAALAAPYDLEEGTVTVAASIGLVISDPSSTVDPAELCHRADTAMYRAKRSGKGRYSFYSDADPIVD